MKTLFVESDPVSRGLIHCMATIADLRHDIVSSAEEALAAVNGQTSQNSGQYNTCSESVGNYSLIITATNLPGISEVALTNIIRKMRPRALVYALTEKPESVDENIFDRIYHKPDAIEAAIRDALSLLGSQSQFDLFSSMIPQIDLAAA